MNTVMNQSNATFSLPLFGKSTTPTEFAIEYLVLFLVLVPLTGGSLGGVTIYHFRQLYLTPTFDTWKLKFNKRYPTVNDVSNEIVALTKCTLATIALLCVSVQLGLYGYNSLFDLNKATPKQNVVNFLISFWVVDLYSYLYHYFGHKIPQAWSIHRFHHKFYNPTPFGVIADDMLDQVVRAMPLLFLPLTLSTLNFPTLSAVFVLDMYYGTLLHSGHANGPAAKVANMVESVTSVDLINRPLNHFLHHAISGGSTPKYCGFYVTIWDKLFGTEDKESLKGFLTGLESRTLKEFNTIALPDYYELAKTSHWVAYFHQQQKKKK